MDLLEMLLCSQLEIRTLKNPLYLGDRKKKKMGPVLKTVEFRLDIAKVQ